VGKKVLAVVVALVAALLVSGCYSLREFNWSDDKVKPGNSTTGKMSLTPSDDVTDRHFFIFVSVITEEFSAKFPSAKWDTTQVFGNPKKMVKDPALETAALDYGGCQSVFAVPRRGIDIEEIAFVTNNAVRDDTGKFVEAKLKSKLTDDAEGGPFGVVQTGAWLDDGDGVPEDPDVSDDEINCYGAVTTNYASKGQAPAAPRLVDSLRAAFGQ